ncbi:MAG: hypothetical protein JWM35_974 [Verrucomicrobia bacterium]|nr:hypothetical protein [Verrucomicrobiota bacterium]
MAKRGGVVEVSTQRQKEAARRTQRPEMDQGSDPKNFSDSVLSVPPPSVSV